MKFFVLVLLFGLAVAIPHTGFYREEGDGDDTTSELEQRLREKLDHVLEKIRDAIDHGKAIGEDLISKLKEMRHKMKDLKIDISEKAKDLLQKMKDRFRDWLDKILGKKDEIQRRNAIGKMKELLKRIKERVIEMKDTGKIRKWIEENIESDYLREILLKLLDRGVDKMIKFLESFETRETRSLTDFLDKLIDVLGEVRLTTKEKFDSFVEFLKETYDGGKEVLKDKAEFVRHLARQFLERAEHSSKKAADEALKFFRHYREDLGKLYDDLEEKVKEIIRQ